MSQVPEDGGKDSTRGLGSCKAHLAEARTVVTDEGCAVHHAVVTWTRLQGETISSLVSTGTVPTVRHGLHVPRTRSA